METFEKILVLDNEFEAEIIEEILTEKNIPHGIVPISDSVLEGIIQMENGWGYVEAPLRFRDEIMKIHSEMNKES